MPCANADTPVVLLSQADAEDAVLCLINEQRQAVGAPDLAMNSDLRAAAGANASEAEKLKWWGVGANPHVNLVTGSTPQDRIHDSGYCSGGVPTFTGENCYGAWFTGDPENATGTTPQAAVDWWMRSPGHRANLLKPAYTDTGIGVVIGPPEPVPGASGAIFVQDFGTCPA